MASSRSIVDEALRDAARAAIVECAKRWRLIIATRRRGARALRCDRRRCVRVVWSARRGAGAMLAERFDGKLQRRSLREPELQHVVGHQRSRNQQRHDGSEPNPVSGVGVDAERRLGWHGELQLLDRRRLHDRQHRFSADLYGEQRRPRGNVVRRGGGNAGPGRSLREFRPASYRQYRHARRAAR